MSLTILSNQPVYAFAVDLGTVSPGTQPEPVVWALGLVRDPLVTFATESSAQNCSGYYKTQYSTPETAVRPTLLLLSRSINSLKYRLLRFLGILLMLRVEILSWMIRSWVPLQQFPRVMPEFWLL
jgi:hypothetical protein